MSISQNFGNVSPSLLLDFANTKTLDNRITFTRSTPACHYDDKTTAMAEQNLVLQSQQLYATPWAGAATITGDTDVAPDGTTTADTLNPSFGVANTNKSQYGTVGQSGTYTLSIYAKVASGTGKVYLSLLDNGWSGATITTCSLTTTWQRFTVTRTLTANNTWYVVVGQTDASTDATTCIVWGAQLEQRSSATAYTATTTQPITNYIPVLLTAGGNQPRFDCNPTTGESLGLLIEEQRTNIYNYSSLNTNSYTQGCTVSQTAIAPDGTLSAIVLKEDTAFSRHGIYSSSMGAYSVTPTTWSVFLKAGVRDKVVFVAYNNGWSASSSAINISSGTPVGNGWYRVSWTATPTSSIGGSYVEIWPADSTSDIYYTGGGWNAFSAWGLQIETGAFATSYIATSGASATRTADSASMTGTNFSSWYNNAEWTLYTEAAWTNITDGAVVSIDDNSFNAVARVTVYETGLAPSIYSNNAFQFNVNTQLPTIRDQFYKTSFAAKANNFAAITNTNAIAINNSGVLFNSSPFQMLIGRSFYGSLFTGRIKKIAYYPIRVSDTNLQALTS